MSICINNDLIWVSIPRCASTSIENSLINSSLSIDNYRYGNDKQYPKHIHIRLTDLHNKFGKMETVSIKRNYFDRWISALQYMFLSYENSNIELSRKWVDIDNDFIYENFSKDYIESIYSFNINDLNSSNYKETIKLKEILNLNLFKFNNINTKVNFEDLDIQFAPYITLLSRMYWVDNQKCTYEFDITEIDKFEKFISERYDIDFKVEKLNESIPVKSKIIEDDKLKKWVFDNFEKRFISRNTLI